LQGGGDRRETGKDGARADAQGVSRADPSPGENHNDFDEHFLRFVCRPGGTSWMIWYAETRAPYRASFCELAPEIH
jgi:hypothetical protein